MSKILDKNCILCSLFVSCKDIKKSHKHVCGEYQPYNKKKIEKALASPKIEGNKKKNSKIDNGEAITAEKQKSDFSEFNNAAFNFENLVNETIENETRNPIAPDIRIDDRDLPMAKNFLEFCSPKFLNYKAWPKQIEIGSHLFAEICPKCSDMDYANDIPKKDTRKQIKNHVVFLEYGVCPECNSRRSKMFKRGQLKVPNELVGLAGQRAAKTTTSVALAAYITHRALKLQNAPLAYGQLESTTLHGVMAALTAQQAAQNIWQPFVNLLQDSPWYTEYFKLMNYYSNKYGEEIYKFKDTFLHFRSRRLLIYPRGPDKKTMRGRTGLFCILDELGWFDSDASKNKIKDNADEVYTALNNSLRTIKSAARKVLRKGVDSIVQPCMISISSPSNKKDMICRLVEKAKDSDTMHWFHYCLTGDTLLNTNKGIIRLDSLGKLDQPGTLKLNNIKLNTTNGKESVKEWHYTGKKDILKITTESGRYVKASENHKILIYSNNEYVWKEAKYLASTDFLCLNSKEIEHNNLLKLNIDIKHSVKNCSRPDLINIPTVPKYMNTKIASVLALLIAEGHINKNTIRIGNANLELLHLIQTYIKSEFNLPSNIYNNGNKSFIRNGKQYNLNSPVYSLVVSSIILKDILVQLGVKLEKSSKKEIPWSILQADSQSQLAFMALYIEGDGWIVKEKKIGIASKSNKLLSQFQVLLDSHGINFKKFKKSIGSASQIDAFNLYTKIEPYLFNKKCNWFKTLPEMSRNYGIPFDYTRNLFLQRRVPKIKHLTFYTDKQQQYKLQHMSYYDRAMIFNNNNRLYLTYKEYLNGRYDAMLLDLKNISQVEHDKLVNCLNQGFILDKISHIKNIGMKNTYDLTMEKNPNFTANGIIVHNSSWEMNKDLDRRDFDSDFKNDYAKAMRDFAAVPPNSSFPFFSELKHVKHIFKANIPNIVKFKQETFRQNRKDYTGASVSISASTNNPKRLLAIDAGYNNNSFAIVGGYMHPELGTVLDIFGEITPSREAPANFTAIASDVIIPIIEQCGVVVLAADRWQSTKLLQDIESNFEEMQTIVHSVKYKDFASYKEDLLNENIVVPKLEGDIKDCLKMGNDDEYPHSFKRKPMMHFAYQLVTVQDLKKEVTKGENSTDDLFRASVLAHRLINDPDLAELLEGEIVGATKNTGVLGVWGSKGTGGGSSSNVSVNGIATVGFINRR